MVMPYKPPTAGPGDWVSRVDNLLLEQRQLILAQTALLQAMTAKLGGGPSVINTCDLFAPSGTTPLEIRQQLETGGFFPYQVKTIADMATAVTDQEIELQGQSILGWSSGTLANVGVRLNSQQADIIYLDRFNPIKFTPFWKIYLTYAAQPGQSLQLFVGRTCNLVPDIYSLASAFEPGSVRSDKDTNFTGAIVSGATEEENLSIGASRIRIRGAFIISDQQLAFQAILFGTDAFADANLDADTFRHTIEFDLPTHGFQIAGAGPYYQSIDGMNVIYQDADGTNEIHVALQNLSATAKAAGAGGEVVLGFIYEKA